MEVCLECGGIVVEEMKEHKVLYGSRQQQVTLTALMPVFTCPKCGFAFYDERGEQAIEQAVKNMAKGMSGDTAEGGG